MSQVITSTQLIHHAPQTDANKEDTFLPPLPLPHSSPPQPFLLCPRSRRADARRKKRKEKRTRVQALPHSWRPWERQKKAPGVFFFFWTRRVSWYKSVLGPNSWAAARTARLGGGCGGVMEREWRTS